MRGAVDAAQQISENSTTPSSAPSAASSDCARSGRWAVKASVLIMPPLRMAKAACR